MQFAKDSVYIALRERLATVNPARVVTIGGLTRPAVLVAENQPVAADFSTARLPNAFELHWGAASMVPGAQSTRRPLMKLECRIRYRTSGADSAGADRGRTLGALDTELLRICAPPRTPKRDYSQPQPLFLGSMVFWGDPDFGDVETADGELRREARLFVFFFPEVDYA